MTTRTEAIQQRRGKDTLEVFDLNLILDYYDTTSTTTDAAARTAILADHRAVDFPHSDDLRGLRNYIVAVSKVQLSASQQEFEDAIDMQKDGVSREMFARILDEMVP